LWWSGARRGSSSSTRTWLALTATVPRPTTVPRESGLVFKAHRLVYHSTLGLRVIKKKKKRQRENENENEKQEGGGGEAPKESGPGR